MKNRMNCTITIWRIGWFAPGRYEDKDELILSSNRPGGNIDDLCLLLYMPPIFYRRGSSSCMTRGRRGGGERRKGWPAYSGTTPYTPTGTFTFFCSMHLNILQEQHESSSNHLFLIIANKNRSKDKMHSLYLASSINMCFLYLLILLLFFRKNTVCTLYSVQYVF